MKKKLIGIPIMLALMKLVRLVGRDKAMSLCEEHQVFPDKTNSKLE